MRDRVTPLLGALQNHDTMKDAADQTKLVSNQLARDPSIAHHAPPGTVAFEELTQDERRVAGTAFVNGLAGDR